MRIIFLFSYFFLITISRYGCRPEIAEFIITAYWEMLLQLENDGASVEGDGNEQLQQLSNALLYHVNRGYHEESAIVAIYSMEGECENSVPMVVPAASAETDSGTTPVTQVVVHHPSAVAASRAMMAGYFMKRAGHEIEGGVLLRHMNALGAQGLERTLNVLAYGKPRFAIFFTVHPF